MRLPAIPALFMAMIPLLASAEESFFFIRVGGAKELVKRVEGDELHVVMPIERVVLPKVKSIYAFRQDMGKGRKYQIQIDLASDLPKRWEAPAAKLGDDILERTFYSPGDPASLHLEFDDSEKIEIWCNLLGKLLNVPQEEIEIDLRDPDQKGEKGRGND